MWRNLSQKRGEKSWSKQLHRPSPHIQWVFLSFPSLYVPLSILLWLSIGGGKGGVRNNFIGLTRISCVLKRIEVEWALEIYLCSTWPYLLNKLGGYYTTHTLCFTKCTKQDTFPLAHSCKQNWVIILLSRGKVYWHLELLLGKNHDGKLGMAERLELQPMTGSHIL